jgi:hypothetical protein
MRRRDGADLRELDADLGPQPGQLDREPRRVQDASQQVRPRPERRAVDHDGKLLAVAGDASASERACTRVRDEPTGDVGVPLAPGEPEPDAQVPVAQRRAQGLLDALGAGRPASDRVLEGPHPPQALVALARDAAVDLALDPAPERAERHRDRQGRDGGAEERPAPQEQPGAEHDHGEGAAEHDRDGAVDDRAVDDAVDLVQPVTCDRDPDRDADRRPREEQHRRHDPDHAAVRGVGDRAHDEAQRDQPRRPGEPLHLQAAVAVGVPVADDDRGDAQEEPGEHRAPCDPGQWLEDVCRRDVERAGAAAVPVLEAGASDQEQDHEEGDGREDRRHRDPPARRGEVAVGEGERDRERPCVEGGPQRHRDGTRHRSTRRRGAAARGLRRVRVAEREQRDGDRARHQDPPDPVAGPVPQDDEAHDGRGQERREDEGHPPPREVLAAPEPVDRDRPREHACRRGGGGQREGETPAHVPILPPSPGAAHGATTEIPDRLDRPALSPGRAPRAAPVA